jgi:hypothetical protein
MKQKIRFEAIVTFDGSFEQFEKLTELMSSMSESVHVIPGNLVSDDPEGVWTYDPESVLTVERIAQMSIGMPRLNGGKAIGGGVKEPHLHMKDEIVLLSPDRFREYVKQVASTMADDIALKADSAQAVRALGELNKLCSTKKDNQKRATGIRKAISRKL